LLLLLHGRNGWISVCDGDERWSAASLPVVAAAGGLVVVVVVVVAGKWKTGLSLED
jgi:hypothetical protein